MAVKKKNKPKNNVTQTPTMSKRRKEAIEKRKKGKK